MATPSDLQGEELAAIVHEIRDRVRSRHHALVDLLPVLHARDRAEAKVAAIGSVNPRPPGLVNNSIQWVKHNIARALGWFVRDQVDFNRAVLGAVEATLESLNEMNRMFATLDSRITDVERGIRHDLQNATDSAEALKSEAAELKDIRGHWVHWREEWQQKLFQNEVHYLRGLADLQASLDVRVAKIDAGYRDSLQLQHNEYEGALRRSIAELQTQFWSDMEKVRRGYETLIHNELRVTRQKAFASATPAGIATPAAAAAPEAPLDIDYNRFSDRFRGNEQYVRERQAFYVPHFRDCKNVLDIGCGRGEFLELMREANVPARGLDLDEESVAICRTKGLQAEVGDVFVWLANEPDGSFDGIFASQVIEHLTPSQVPRFVKLCSQKLRQGGVIALETPNPECLAIFATHFYIDPTHQRPVPPSLLVFYFEEFGLGGIEVHRLSPARESMPTLNELPAEFRDAFFGGLDYCGIARKL